MARATRRDILKFSAAGLPLLAGGCTTLATGASAGRTRNDAFLDDVQRRTFAYFWDTTNPANGLARDRYPRPSFASMAAVGFALTAYPIGVHRGFVSRSAAAERTASTLRFLANAPQGDAPSGMTGFKGFFYHFVDMERGARFEKTELSTVDTALLLGGILFAKGYFDRPEEVEIRELADRIYARVDWTWAQARPPTIALGWSPEEGHLPYDWVAYSEGMLVYLLALGSATHPVQRAAWQGWAAGLPRHWGTEEGRDLVRFPPLFGHQYSHLWVDFRGIRDSFMREKGLDYFENSRRAVLAQRDYAIRNSMQWNGYGPRLWGLTACDGPADVKLVVEGKPREFRTYAARGPGQFDDGTIAPTAVGGSVPFAPDLCIDTLMAMKADHGNLLYRQYGYIDALNLSIPPNVDFKHGAFVPKRGWYDGDYLGIDQGPIIAMIENHRSGLIWNVMRRDPHIRRGLTRAGFTGGWLA
jgi:hypothetical protein